MTTDQLHDMLVQRGYTVASDDEKLYILLSTGTLILPSSQIGLLTQEQWEQEIDVLLGQGQHHMMCSCGLPVLREHISRNLTLDEYSVKDGVITFPQPLPEGIVNMGWEEDGQDISITKANVVTAVLYRLVDAGPQSEPVTYCPQCGQELSVSIREVQDD